MHKRRTFLACLTLPFFSNAGTTPAKTAYRETVQRERNKYSKEILSADGPLTGVALFRIPGDKLGSSTVGTDPSCSCTFVAAGGPAHLGDLSVVPDGATLQFAPGLRATVDGKPVSSISVKRGGTFSYVEAQLGTLTMALNFDKLKLLFGL